MDDKLMEQLMDYEAEKGFSAEEIRFFSYQSKKRYFEPLAKLLEKTYPAIAETIIAGLLDIKSHGVGIVMPEKAIERGLACFPEGYLEKNELPKNTDLSSLNVVTHEKFCSIPTFPTEIAKEITKHFEKFGAKIVKTKNENKERVKKYHDHIDLLNLSIKRVQRPEVVQLIDEHEAPLDEDLIEYALECPGLLFESYKQKSKVTIAITGFPGIHARKDHEQILCYFNNEAIFARELAKQGKKVTILNLDVNLAHGLVKFCSGQENITLIGLHVDPEVDTTIYPGENKEIKENILLNFLDAGTNGREYLEKIKEVVRQIPGEQDVLLVVAGVNAYLFDSTGLLCVEGQNFKKIGEVVGEAAKNRANKIIVTKGGGYDKEAPLIFTEFCLGITEGGRNNV